MVKGPPVRPGRNGDESEGWIHTPPDEFASHRVRGGGSAGLPQFILRAAVRTSISGRVARPIPAYSAYEGLLLNSDLAEPKAAR